MRSGGIEWENIEAKRKEGKREVEGKEKGNERGVAKLIREGVCVEIRVRVGSV